MRVCVNVGFGGGDGVGDEDFEGDGDVRGEVQVVMKI